MIFDILLGVIFLSVLFFVAIRDCNAEKGEEGYLLAGRKTSLFALIATLVMTELNTATLLSFSSMGYLAGKWALALPLVFLIGLLFYAFSVAKKWKEFDGLSVSSFFTKRYGKDVGFFASGALLIAMLGFSGAYVKSLTVLFSPLFPGTSLWLLSGALTLAVLILMIRGGLVSIIRADVFSFLVCVIFFPLMAYFASKGSAQEVSALTLSPKFVLSLIILTMFTYILAPWYGQKIFAARSKKVAFLAVLISSVLVFLFYGLAVLSTWFFKKGGGIVPHAELAFPMMISKSLPSGMRGLGYGILLALSATTLTGVWSAMSTLVIGDFFTKTSKTSVVRSQVLTGCFAILSFLIANLVVDRVFDKLILANIPIAALSFALLGGFYWKRASRAGAIASIIMGWGIGIFSYLYFGEAGGYTWYWAIIGIPLIFFTGISVSILIPNKYPIIV